MSAQEDFEADARSIRAVRLFVTQALSGVVSTDDVVLAASELATNVIRHARTSFTVRVVRDKERVRLEVSDGSSVMPAVEDITESQRGWRLIEALSERWGVAPTETGKTVWVEFRSEETPGHGEAAS